MSANVVDTMSADNPPPRPDEEPAPAQDPEPPRFPPPAVNPYARPIQAEPEAERPVIPGLPPQASLARRLAGFFLLVNSVLVLVWVAVSPSAAQLGPGAAGDPFQAAGGAGSIVPAIIDAFIGISLLRGSASLVPWAILRCIGGLVLSTAIYATKDPAVLVHQVLLSGSLVGLLAGQAGRARTAIAGSLAGLALVLELFGIAVTAAGQNPLGSLFMSLSGEIEPSPVEHATGRAAAYELSFPNKKWHLRSQAAAARDNPIADRWFVRPDKDAHVLVVAEHAPGKVIPVEAYTDAVLGQLKKNAPDTVVRARGPWPVFGDRGRLVDAGATGQNGMKLEWRYALVTSYERAYYVVGFASRETMPEVESEIRAILDSLKLPESVQTSVPPDIEPAPVTEVRGSLLPYTLRPPDDQWRLRKADVLKAQNAAIDRWLTRLDIDAHVFVVAEQVEQGTVPLAAYADAVIDAVKKDSTRFDVLERVPWAKFPADGVRIRASVTREAVDLEYDYALYARGQRAFQIVGFTTKAGYPAAEKAISKVIDSFEPPP